MGCFASKRKSNSESQPAEKQEFSWDKRRKNIDPNDYILKGEKGRTIVKGANSIKGQQFCIEDCKDCVIFLLDHADSVTVDLCENCKIVVAPVEGSFFIRDSTNCTVIAACQQFRTRNCDALQILLHCTTKPSIESSKNMQFGCFQFNYKGLLDQFKVAKLNVFKNEWSSVYDFTPSASSNWSFLPSSHSPPFTVDQLVSEYKIELEEGVQSVVPLSWGTNRAKPFQHSRLLLFSAEDTVNVMALLEHILSQAESRVTVIQTQQQQLQQKTAKELMKSSTDASNSFIQSMTSKEVIGVELNGDSFSSLSEWINAFPSTVSLYCSETDEIAAAHISSFFDTVTLEM